PFPRPVVASRAGGPAAELRCAACCTTNEASDLSLQPAGSARLATPSPAGGFGSLSSPLAYGRFCYYNRAPASPPQAALHRRAAISARRPAGPPPAGSAAAHREGGRAAAHRGAASGVVRRFAGRARDQRGGRGALWAERLALDRREAAGGLGPSL